MAHWAIPVEPKSRDRSRTSVTFSFLHKGPNHSGGQFNPDGLIRFNRLETYLDTVIKFIYSEKATNFFKISTIDLFYVVMVKSTVEMSQNFVAFSDYINFKEGAK